MGISGLLPLLKCIQVNKHLSEFSGQTLAVDAYVWLHRGVYACAMEVATGKKTTKYVEYAMHRVRLLRHFKIQPYIVFDGGPLPAKRGTESERKRKRDSNLVEANRLASQGKHTQARDYYVKCVDVTPEMAYQFIKALRAESVPYVVAPYEADAQLAYLERIGLVDGIITEDSDLLVFGCRNVLFKLDVVASMVTSISRSDFGSVTTSDSGISLVGWSDAQFRAMAILSGCDYLASIQGVGLKTAWSLLRKHKTAEKVVRMLRLEGKKDVPANYIHSLKLVEKVFLHQRVYDPVTGHLVHLTDVPQGENLNDMEEAYVGENLDPSLARKVAIGEVCPITLLPIVDINSSFVPCVLKSLPLVFNNADRGGKEKEKNQSILSFFSASTGKVMQMHPDIALGPKQQPMTSLTVQQGKVKNAVVAGKSSGKRRLSDMMDTDCIAHKRKRDENRPVKRPVITHSKFFGASACVEEDIGMVAGPTKLSPFISSPRETPLKIEDIDLNTEEPDLIEQEDGYLSPTPSFIRLDTPDLSSPPRPPKAPPAGGSTKDADFDADVLSSPTAQRGNRDTRFDSKISSSGHTNPRRDTDCDCRDIDTEDKGLDLQGIFGEELTSEIDNPEPENSFTSTTSSSSSGPFTPNGSREGPSRKELLDESDEVVDDAVPAYEIRVGNVANGWLEKWRYGSERQIRTPLRRMETTVTAEGRQRPRSLHNSSRASITPSLKKTLALKTKHGTVQIYRNQREVPRDHTRPTGSGRVDDMVSNTEDRLVEFRSVSDLDVDE